jgi:hypothetical protein
MTINQEDYLAKTSSFLNFDCISLQYYFLLSIHVVTILRYRDETHLTLCPDLILTFLSL